MHMNIHTFHLRFFFFIILIASIQLICANDKCNRSSDHFANSWINNTNYGYSDARLLLFFFVFGPCDLSSRKSLVKLDFIGIFTRFIVSSWYSMQPKRCEEKKGHKTNSHTIMLIMSVLHFTNRALQRNRFIWSGGFAEARGITGISRCESVDWDVMRFDSMVLHIADIALISIGAVCVRHFVCISSAVVSLTLSVCRCRYIQEPKNKFYQ